METTTKTYMCLGVRDALYQQMFRGFKRADGTKMTRREVFNELCDELKQGHEVIPMDRGCGNPCKRAGYDGFAYGGRDYPGVTVRVKK